MVHLKDLRVISSRWKPTTVEVIWVCDRKTGSHLRLIEQVFLVCWYVSHQAKKTTHTKGIVIILNHMKAYLRQNARSPTIDRVNLPSTLGMFAFPRQTSATVEHHTVRGPKQKAGWNAGWIGASCCVHIVLFLPKKSMFD